MNKLLVEGSTATRCAACRHMLGESQYGVASDYNNHEYAGECDAYTADSSNDSRKNYRNVSASFAHRTSESRTDASQARHCTTPKYRTNRPDQTGATN